MNKLEFTGSCFKIELCQRGGGDLHINVKVHVEDVKMNFSSYWLDELIEKLQAAREYCGTQKPDLVTGRQYGWRFK